MELVCETCGGSSFSDCFIMCGKCSSHAVHRYCLGEVKLKDAEIDWQCDSCHLKCCEIAPSIRQQDLVANEVKKKKASGTSRLTVGEKQTSVATNNMVTEVGRKRKRRRRLILLEDEDVDEDVVSREAGLNDDENKYSKVQSDGNDQNVASLKPVVDHANGVEKLESGGCSTFPESSLRIVENDSAQCLGLEGNVCENISCHPTLDQASKYMQDCTLSEPAWSGSFSIRSYRYGEMKAHLSGTACERVLLEARSMPTMLSVHVHQRSDVWPKSFQISPPHVGDIALYFFPKSAKDEDSFEILLADLIDSDLALKVCFDNSELLVFPSIQLPEPYHRFHERNYIWGVFKNKSSEGSPHIGANLGEGRAILQLSDHGAGRIIDSVDSLPSRSPFPSLSSPTPDDIERHGMVDSVENKLRSRSEDSVMRKILLSRAHLSHHQQSEPTHCETKMLQRDEVTENVLLPLDMEFCCPVLRNIGLCLEDDKSNLELPVLSNAQDGVPMVENLRPQHVEVQHDTSNCLNLFPLAVEDLAVTVRMGDNSGINLELGLGRQTAPKKGVYKSRKPLDSARSLLCADF